MSDGVGGLVLALGAALLFLAFVIPTRPRRSLSRLMEEEHADYFTRRAQASARAGVRLWPIRYALRVGAGAVILAGLLIIAL